MVVDMKQISLKALPYQYDTLEPVISREIVELHHDKHQLAYVNATNAAIEKSEKNREVMRDISFNYNGVLLHEIYWDNMRGPRENNKPSDSLMGVIVNDFGSWEKFQSEMSQAATTVEASGWAVLWKTENGLLIGQLEKHNLLGINGSKPILVNDVWEHSYYLQYKNNRAEYVKNWWQVVNWEDVEQRYNVAI